MAMTLTQYYSLSLWDLNDYPFAESTDLLPDGSLNPWGRGLNDNWRDIDEQLYFIHEGLEINLQSSKPANITGNYSMWLLDNTGNMTKDLYFEGIDKIYLDALSEIVATQEWTKQYIKGLDPQESVLDFYDASISLPATPSTGDRYICSVAGNGWTKDYIYQYNGSTWDEYIPNDGWSVWNEADNHLYSYNGSVWVDMGTLFDHNSLSGLQGGDGSNQFYHLDNTDYGYLTDVNAQLNQLLETGSPVFTGMNLTNGNLNAVDLIEGANLKLDDQFLSSPIPLSETGVAGLSSIFNSSSVIGAINESGKIATYVVTTEDEFDDALSSISEGESIYIVPKAGGYSKSSAFIISSINRIRIFSNGAVINRPANDSCIKMSGTCEYITISGINFDGSGQTGNYNLISIQNVYDHALNHSRILNNTFSNNSWHALNLYHMPNGFVAFNTFYQIDGYCIYSLVSLDNTYIHGNLGANIPPGTSGNDHGFVFSSGFSPVIEGNVWKDSNGSATVVDIIRAGRSTGTGDHLFVSDNTFFLHTVHFTGYMISLNFPPTMASKIAHVCNNKGQAHGLSGKTFAGNECNEVSKNTSSEKFNITHNIAFDA